MDKPLINKVAQSSLLNINLEDYYPSNKIVTFDIKDFLYMDLILKEKDFRLGLKEHDWAQYKDCILLVQCSTDAIIPLWAYMLVSTYAEAHAIDIYNGTQEEYLKKHYDVVIGCLDVSEYEDRMVVIKGCSKQPVPAHAYLTLTAKLKPLAKSIMFGEPCSTVPIYKKPKK